MKIREELAGRLPVYGLAGAINESLRVNPRLVVTSPPGSGKSTLLPLTILGDIPEGKVVMLEPRRAAARQIAMRMAEMTGEKPGETVGYRMRFESQVSARTRIEVVTEGVLERMLTDDPTLEGIAAVIFDEFHERSLAADLTLAMTLTAQQTIRPDLRIIIMSATIDSRELCEALDAPMIEGEGKMYDVRIIHGEDFDIRDCVSAVVSGVRRACREQKGNILAFLPGQGEILKAKEALENIWPDVEVLPLYGQLGAAEQYRAIEYNPVGRRKIVLATPIAETSLTIEGITAVVDSGLCRTARYDRSTGLTTLETVRISQDMARQRAGRAGRLSEGVCYRLWSKAAEHRMQESRIPEIAEADLSGMLLEIARWGCGTCSELPWLTSPSPGHVDEGLRLLRSSGALDESGTITAHGKRMASMPCHPRIANMLIEASDRGSGALGADIAAILEEKDQVRDETDADIGTRISLLRDRRRRGRGGEGGWSRHIKVAEQYRRMLSVREDNGPVDEEETGMLLARAYPERIAMQMEDGSYRLPDGRNVTLDERDDLRKSDFLVAAAMGRRIFLASPIGRKSLERLAVWHENLSWSSREGRVVARRELRIGVLTIDSRPMENPERREITDAIIAAAPKEGRSMFDFNDAFVRMQERISTVAGWHPELGLPEVSVERMLSTASEWLPLYIGDATTIQELRKIDLCEVVYGMMDYGMKMELDRIAPTHLRLPGGRNVRIDYRPGTPHPVVSARLQDCLGLTDTPRLDDGKRPVLMELLSPGFKPVQLTQDLRGFWSNTYFEVRKELRRRYPKHRWPDNPLEYHVADSEG